MKNLLIIIYLSLLSLTLNAQEKYLIHLCDSIDYSNNITNTNEFKVSFKSFFYYDENYRLITSINKINADQIWKDYSKTSYSYEKNQENRIREYWESNKWNLEKKMILQWDSNHQPLSEKVYSFYQNNWYNEKQILYYYNDNNLPDSILFFNVPIANFELYKKIKFEYDQNGYLIKVIFFNSKALSINLIINYINNENGLPILEEWIDLNNYFYGDPFQPDYKFYNTYNSDNIQLSRLCQEKKLYSAIYENKSLVEYDNNLSFYKIYQWHDNKWSINQEVNFQDYNLDCESKSFIFEQGSEIGINPITNKQFECGFPKFIIYKSYNEFNGAISNINKTDFYYRNIDKVNPHEIILYPNPTENLFTVHSQDEIIELNVLSSNGSKLAIDMAYENVIDLTHFDEGIYFVEAVFNDGKKSRKKIVKI